MLCEYVLTSAGFIFQMCPCISDQTMCFMSDWWPRRQMSCSSVRWQCKVKSYDRVNTFCVCVSLLVIILVTEQVNASLPWPMERFAKLYICMAMAKSSRLLRNWKKDRNSSKTIPCKETPSMKSNFWHRNVKRHLTLQVSAQLVGSSWHESFSVCETLKPSDR